MGVKDEQILRTAKEVVVKFIEIGRISPATFSDNFSKIYDSIHDSVKNEPEQPVEPKPEEKKGK